MAETPLLEEIGLTENEAKVYSSLIELGESPAGTVAEKAKMHRRSVYDILKRLVEKGFVSHIKKDRKEQYMAVDPKKIIEILQKKVDIATSYLPEILKKYRKSELKQEVEVFEGKEGMKLHFNIASNVKGNVYCFGLTGKANSMLKYFMPQILKRIAKIKNKVCILKNYDATGFEDYEGLPNVYIRTLPKKYGEPTQIFLYEDYSAITIWSENPLVILIKSKGIQAGFKKYFNVMWKLAKP